MQVCPYLDVPSKRGYEPQKCVRHTKHTNVFLQRIAAGAFELVPPAEYDELREGYAAAAAPGAKLPTTDSLHTARRATLAAAAPVGATPAGTAAGTAAATGAPLGRAVTAVAAGGERPGAGAAVAPRTRPMVVQRPRAKHVASRVRTGRSH